MGERKEGWPKEKTVEKDGLALGWAGLVRGVKSQGQTAGNYLATLSKNANGGYFHAI